MEAKKFLQAADPNYKNPIISMPLTAVDSLVLEANVAKRYTLPTDTELLLLNSVANIYVLFGTSSVVAELPDEYDDILDGSASMLNPGLICNLATGGLGLTHMSVICEEATKVNIYRWSRR